MIPLGDSMKRTSFRKIVFALGLLFGCLVPVRGKRTLAPDAFRPSTSRWPN